MQRIVSENKPDCATLIFLSPNRSARSSFPPHFRTVIDRPACRSKPPTHLALNANGPANPRANDPYTLSTSPFLPYGPLEIPGWENGAGEGTRTLNLRITNPVLYQLSYASVFADAQNIPEPFPSATSGECCLSAYSSEAFSPRCNLPFPSPFPCGARGGMGFSIQSICPHRADSRRSNSNRITAAAVETFNDPTPPCIGMRTR